MAYDYIVSALRDTWRTTQELLDNRPQEDYARSTPCPNWTVQDVVSHLVGFEQMLAKSRDATIEIREAVTSPSELDEANELQVLSRRMKSGVEVLEEFRLTTMERLDQLERLDESQWVQNHTTFVGLRPYYEFMEMRVVDSWIHLHDLRDGLLEPADEHGIAEEIVMNRFEASLPFVIGKKCSFAEGTNIRFNLSGRLARTVSISVKSGRAVVQSFNSDPLVEITTPIALFWRRCAGRISPEAFLCASATLIRGDADTAREIAHAMTIVH